MISKESLEKTVRKALEGCQGQPCLPTLSGEADPGPLTMTMNGGGITPAVEVKMSDYVSQSDGSNH